MKPLPKTKTSYDEAIEACERATSQLMQANTSLKNNPLPAPEYMPGGRRRTDIRVRVQDAAERYNSLRRRQQAAQMQ